MKNLGEFFIKPHSHGLLNIRLGYKILYFGRMIMHVELYRDGLRLDRNLSMEVDAKMERKLAKLIKRA